MIIVFKKMYKNKFGSLGEKLACEFLIRNGYIIHSRNWRYKHLEVDLIAELNNKIIIIEIKTRSSNEHGDPWEFVDKKKQKNLVQAANFYLEINNIDKEVSFDIISVIIKDYSEHEIQHIKDAFSPLIGM